MSRFTGWCVDCGASMSVKPGEAVSCGGCGARWEMRRLAGPRGALAGRHAARQVDLFAAAAPRDDEEAFDDDPIPW